MLAYRLVAQPWGTEVVLLVDGLEPASSYDVFVRADENDQRRVGGFSGDACGVIRFASSLSASDLERLWVLADDESPVGWTRLSAG